MEENPRKRRRFQFSLRTLLIVMTVLSVLIFCAVQYIGSALETTRMRRLNAEQKRQLEEGAIRQEAYFNRFNSAWRLTPAVQGTAP